MSTWAWAIGRALVSFLAMFLAVALIFAVVGGGLWLVTTHPAPTLVAAFLIFLVFEVRDQRRTIETIKRTERYLKDNP